MRNNIFKAILLLLFLMFLALYYSANTGLVDYQAKSKMELTEEQIKKFESDVKNNVEIDLEEYIVDYEGQYDNNISKTTMNISKTIGETIQNTLNFIFEKIDKSINS